MRATVCLALICAAVPALASAQALPDLVVQSATVGPRVFRGEVAAVAVTIANVGSADAEGFLVSAQLSALPGPAALSAWISLAAQTSTAITLDLPIPATTPRGSDQVAVVVDAESVVTELRESNNRATVPVEVVDRAADVTGSFGAMPSEGYAGEPVDVEVTVSNLGYERVLVTHASLMLAPARGAPVEVSGLFFLDMAPLGGATERFPAALPGLPAGVYRWLLLVDTEAEVAESDESNNRIEGPEIVVRAARPQILSERLAPGWVGRRYSERLEGSALSQITWSALTRLPVGLQLDASSGVVSGTPQVASEGVVRFRAESRGEFNERDVLVIMNPEAISLGEPQLPPAIVGRPYTFTFLAAGGAPPYSYAVTGPLPPGIRFDPRGILSGVPTAVGVATLAVSVNDTRRNRAEAIVQLTVQPAPDPLVIETTELPPARVGQTYCEQGAVLIARGGTPPLAWRIIEPRPIGLFIQGDGKLCGTPQQAGTVPLEVGVRAADGQEDSVTLTLVIEPASVSTPEPPPSLELDTVAPVGCGCATGAPRAEGLLWLIGAAAIIARRRR